MHKVLFKGKAIKLGAHVHIDIYVRWADGGETWQNAGVFVVDDEQYEEIKDRLKTFVDELEYKDGTPNQPEP